MTTRTITHKCGHEVEREINKIRESAIAKQVEFHASRDCFDCFKENSAKNDLEVIAEYPLLLAKLEGSEKQVSWAEGIRVRKLVQIIAYQKEHFTLNGELTFSEYIFSLADLTSAKFWIDTRDLEESFFFGLNKNNRVHLLSSGWDHEINVWSAKAQQQITVDAKLIYKDSKVFLALRGFQREIKFERTRGEGWQNPNNTKLVGGSKWYEREVV